MIWRASGQYVNILMSLQHAEVDNKRNTRTKMGCSPYWFLDLRIHSGFHVYESCDPDLTRGQTQTYSGRRDEHKTLYVTPIYQATLTKLERSFEKREARDWNLG